MPAERTPRRHELFFSPRDYLNDPAVLSMSTLARGVYSTLLFAAWDLDKPGVVPANDTALAGLARCTPDEWAATKEQVVAAFDTSKPGVWVQKRMVREHERQTSFIRRQKAHGKAGRNKQLVGLPRATPRATPGPIPPVTPVTPVFTRENLTLQICPSGDGRDRIKSQKDEWLEAFEKDFWPAYPRKVGKRAARRAWLCVKPWSQSNCDTIFSGLRRWQRHWSDRETAPEYIPYPATWLNQGRYESEP